MKVGILTSSRADYGIYQPLLQKFKADDFFQLEIIAFGTHFSQYHGYSISQIKEDGFKKIHGLNTLLANDDQEAISSAYGLTVVKFAQFWDTNKFDLVFCLGDRYEMSAAVQASIPFGVSLAHIHGGETTLGAIDNSFRHQITIASKFHFTSTDQYAQRVTQLVGSGKYVTNVGALSLDGMENMDLPDEKVMREKYSIPSGNYALVTFHPETVFPDRNIEFARQVRDGLARSMDQLNFVVTLPNADTLGTVYRDVLNSLRSEFSDQVVLIENFGRRDYFAAMKYSSLLIGNTSSGIIEAASLNKYFINVGNRQQGRAQSANVVNCDFDARSIQKHLIEALTLGNYNGKNIYYKEGTVDKIINAIKCYFDEKL